LGEIKVESDVWINESADVSPALLPAAAPAFFLCVHAAPVTEKIHYSEWNGAAAAGCMVSFGALLSAFARFEEPL
jgi:hypothetical protein